jgi:HEAT repeats
VKLSLEDVEDGTPVQGLSSCRISRQQYLTIERTAVKQTPQTESLAADLRSKDPMRRIRARSALVKIGKPAVPLLINLLSDPVEHVRWEVCKALGLIRESSSAPALVDALRDKSVEVQWLAAEALIALGSRAVIPLLRSLERNFESPPLRQGAHHVLHTLEREKRLGKRTIAVVDSLRSLEPPIETGVAARNALDGLLKAEQS